MVVSPIKFLSIIAVFYLLLRLLSLHLKGDQLGEVVAVVTGLFFIVVIVTFPFIVGNNVASKVKTKKMLQGIISSLVYSVIFNSFHFVLIPLFQSDDVAYDGFLILTLFSFLSGCIGAFFGKQK